MSWVEIISSLLGLSCVFLAGRNSKYNFWVGYVYNIFLFVLFWRQHLYSAMLLQPVAFAINAFGHWRWTHPRKGEESTDDASALKVRRASAREWLAAVILIAAAGCLWAIFLQHKTEDPSPWLDSYMLMVTFLAQYFSAQKYWDCWLVWLVINVGNIILYLSAGLTLMPVVSALFLANGVWSLISWLRLYKNELK